MPMQQEEKIVKKRGRKSKTAIVAKDVVIDYKKYDKNKIIHIKKDALCNNISVNNSLEEHEETNYYKVDITYKVDKCWNCVQEIKNLIGYPLSYDNNVFHCYGDFCSYGCCSRYIIDNYNNQELWNKLHLLNVMYNKTHKTTNMKVDPCPDRRLLKIFGGKMTIEEYHNNNNKHNYYDITIPPVVPVNHNAIKHDDLEHINHTEELRLFRKNTNKKSQNNIFSTMNIKTS